MSLVTGLWHEVQHAAQMLWKQPAFAITAIFTLALGIGATTAIFSVVNGVLIKALAYPDADTLVRIVHSIGGSAQPYFSDLLYLTYVDNGQTFEDVGVWSPGETATITGRGDPEEVRALRASRGLLTTLGVRPKIGRWFSAADDAPGAADTVMLANGYWQRHFGGDALDHTLTINGRTHQIIGVMPPDFRFSSEFEIILPLQIDRGAPIPEFRLLGIARLKPGVTLALANADVASILRIWLLNAGQKDPAFLARYQPTLQPLKANVIGDVGSTLWVLMAAIAIVLLMACANIANLMLVRADARRQEFATRAALGASTKRLARQLLAESVTLGLLGGALGVGLAYGGLRALVAIGPSDLPRLSEISMDAVVLGFALAISLVSGLLFGLVPILKHARPRLVDALGGGRGASLTRDHQSAQQVLVVTQVALALVLLITAGLLIRSFQELRRVNPGFTQPDRVQTFSISIPETLVAEPERVVRMQQEVLERIAGVPSVASVAFATRLPMGSDRSSTALTVEGRADDRRTPSNRQVKIISPGLFRTLGIPLVAGRDFTWTDVHQQLPVTIVSQNLAREFWGTPTGALGRRVREYYDNRSPWREVVGVVADVHDDGADQPAPATVYWPTQPNEQLLGMSGYQARRVSMAIRTDRTGTQSLFNDLREAVRSVSRTLPLARVRTLDEMYHESMARTSFTLWMLVIAATMALLLGISGIYGVIAYAISQQRREIGIRLALGAQPREIRQLFLRRGLFLVGVGVAIGFISAVGATQLIQALLFGTSPFDPIAFAAMTLVLAAAAGLASYLPTRRAVALDPVATLRAE
jgi:putative ABC transport system permease protein